MFSCKIYTIPDNHRNRDEDDEKQSQTPRSSKIIRWIQIFPYPTTTNRSTSSHLSPTQQKQRRIEKSESMKQRKTKSLKLSNSGPLIQKSRTERKREEMSFSQIDPI